MDNLFEIGMNKLLVARRNGNELILGYIDARDENLGFHTKFQNVRLAGSMMPVGVLSSPLDSFSWDTLTFYGIKYMQRKLPSAVIQKLKSIKSDEGIPLWQATNSYYEAYELMLSNGITPILIDKWSDIQIAAGDGTLTKLQGPVVYNIPLLNKKRRVHSYLHDKINEELQTIRVSEKEISEEEMLKLFKDYI